MISVLVRSTLLFTPRATGEQRKSCHHSAGTSLDGDCTKCGNGEALMAQLTVAVSAVVDRGKGNPTSGAMTDESAKQVPRRAEWNPAYFIEASAQSQVPAMELL